MALWLSSLPIWLCAFLVVGVTTGATMILTVLVRRMVGFDRLETHNEVAGFKFAVLGVIYAVLLGFAVITVWEKFRDAQAAVTTEAAAAATIYRLTGGLDVSERPPVQAAVRHYLTLVLTREVETMVAGKADLSTTLALNALYGATLAARPVTLEASDVFQAMLGELATLTEARRDRLELSTGTVPGVVWTVLFGGALMNVAFVLFFGTKHVAAQVIMAGMLAAVIFMALFVIIMINYPFAGGVRVSIEPLQYVLENLDSQDAAGH